MKMCEIKLRKTLKKIRICWNVSISSIHNYVYDPPYFWQIPFPNSIFFNHICRYVIKMLIAKSSLALENGRLFYPISINHSWAKIDLNLEVIQSRSEQKTVEILEIIQTCFVCLWFYWCLLWNILSEYFLYSSI